MTIFLDESVIMKEKDNEIQWLWSDYSKKIYNQIRTLTEKYEFKLKIICLTTTDEMKNKKKLWCSSELKISTKDIKFIKKRTQKLQFANPESILVDSKMDMVNSFVYSGGHSIYCDGSEWFCSDKKIYRFEKAIEYDSESGIVGDCSELIRKKIKFFLYSYGRLYVYRECVKFVLQKTEEYYNNHPKISENPEVKISEKFSTIFSLYQEAKNIKEYKTSSDFEFDPLEFLQSYGFVERRTNGEGKKVFDKVCEHFKIHHKINIFDLPEHECKAILLYVYLNLFSNGLALGIDNSKKYMKIKN